jgi:hypothetical protein
MEGEAGNTFSLSHLPKFRHTTLACKPMLCVFVFGTKPSFSRLNYIVASPTSFLLLSSYFTSVLRIRNRSENMNCDSDFRILEVSHFHICNKPSDVYRFIRITRVISYWNNSCRNTRES